MWKNFHIASKGEDRIILYSSLFIQKHLDEIIIVVNLVTLNFI